MRHLLVVTFLVLGGITVSAQGTIDTMPGEVTFTTSQSVYIKFASTRGIEPGDTLFVLRDGQLTPALIVKNISSTSCVSSPLPGFVFEKGNSIISKQRRKAPAKPDEPIPAPKEPAENVVVPEPEEQEVMIKVEPKKQTYAPKKLIGRLSAASYVNFSDRHETDKQRMRYTLTFNTNRIGKSGLSAETYISFRHTLGEWQEVRDDFKRTFKIYSLALQYDFNDGSRISLGRKTNPNISNIGAIDGLQLEKHWKQITVGLFGGSRPDHTDYGFNFDLVQFGAYAGHMIESKNGIVQSTLAFAEQRNHSMTDRRYAYFQHVNSAIKRVNIFTSLEFDLYTLKDDQPKSTFDVSSIYFSLRYKVSNKLSVFGSYDARKNIIYYETYKNFIDQLLEDETRQGYRFSFNYRPWKRITIGTSAGYRFQKDNPDPSKNLNSYISISQIPHLQVSTTLSLVMIQSAYLDGIIYGVRMSKDLVKGKLFGEAEFRLVEYRYRNVESAIKQSIAGGHVTWRFSKKLSFAFNYEGEIQQKKLNNRIYTNVIQRF